MSETERGSPSPLRREGSPTQLSGLLARAREGDETALDLLCGHFVPTMRMWALARTPDPEATMPDVASIVRATLQHIPNRTAEYQRIGSCLYALRQAVWRRVQNPTSLEQTIGSNRASSYERRLDGLDPLKREALVLCIEMKRDFEQMAEDLDVSSPEAASELFQRAFLQLAEEMTHDF